MAAPIYFLIARARAGEIDAIGRLAPATQGLIRPTLDFPRQKGKDRRPIGNYLSDKVCEIAASWGAAKELCFDFSRYEPDAKLPDGRHIAEAVFDVARHLHLKAIPVLGPPSLRGPGTDYFEAVSRIVTRDQRGAALRVPYEDFSDKSALERVLREVVALTSISPGHIDIYLDAYSLALIPIDSRDEISLADMVRMAALTTQSMGYRRTAFIASNAPDSTVRYKKGSALKVERTEFRVWRRVVADPLFAFLGFGDYGIVDPGQVETDAPVIPPSRVRITTEDEYVFYKGSRDGIRKVSAAAVAEGSLMSSGSSWGANAVRECAAGYGDPGGPAQWISRDTSMHIEGTLAAMLQRFSADSAVHTVSDETGASPWLQNSLGLADRE